MKKLTAFILAAIMLFVFSACDNEKTPENESEPQAEPVTEADESEIVMAIAKKQYDCLAVRDVKGMEKLLSADLLLDIDYDVEAFINNAYENLEHHYGTNGRWEMGEMTVEYYDERRVVMTREEYTKDEENNDGFKAPLITEMCKVSFDLFITTDEGEFTEEDSSVILVKEDGEWKVW